MSKFKEIKVVPENAKAIEAALYEVNGRARSHAYTAYSEIENIAEYAEEWIGNLLPQKNRPGALFVSQSGDGVANSYKNTRQGTEVTLLRRGSGWFLIDVAYNRLYTDPGKDRLIFKPSQRDAAVKRFIFQSGFEVSNPEQSA